MKAQFKCLGCGHKWESGPGPTMCPRCGWIWVKWVNYEEWRAKNKIEIGPGRVIG